MLCHNSYTVKSICSLSWIQTLIYLRFISAASNSNLSDSSIGSSFKYETDRLQEIGVLGDRSIADVGGRVYFNI